MELILNNIGPIQECKINLNKRLTLFCGPNNSGKTYTSFIIYALTKSSLKFYKSKIEDNLIDELITNKTINFLLDVNDIWNYRNEELNQLKISLDSVFGISKDNVNSLFQNFNIQINETKKEFEKNILKMNFENEFRINDLKVILTKHELDNRIEIVIKENIISKENIQYLKLFLISKIYSLISFYPFSSSFILPVERNSIYTFSKELSIQKQEFLDRAQELGNKNNKNSTIDYIIKRNTRYPLPIRDGLEISDDLYNYSKIKSDFYSLAEEIENELLQGKIIVTKEGEVQFQSNKAKIKKIPIHISASIVKTLSSLIFYLKHLAVKNELIIIDEPELNLHPNNQVILTRIFAKLINSGFRLLVSTHSDYIIREFNNLIMLSNSKINNELKSKLSYSEDINLEIEQISVYLFNYKNLNSKKISISNVKIDETGFEISTIDDTINILNDTSEQLFYKIKYGENG